MGRLFSYEDKDREVFWNLHSRQSVSHYNTIWTIKVRVYGENMQDILRKELLIPAGLLYRVADRVELSDKRREQP